MLRTVFTVLEALLALNLLIFVHELGHFLAARWRGMKIDRFAVWFGKPLWKKKINGVEYAFGWIPAGGYVALPQMASMEMIEGKSETAPDAPPLPPVSPLDKMIVAFAGPLFSFLLAVAFAFVVWGVGRPDQSSKDSTTIGWVDANGPAGKAGLRAGDKILEVDGHRVTQFAPTTQDSVTWRIVTSEGTNIAIRYSRDGEEGLAMVTPTKLPTKWYERKSLRKILILPPEEAVIAAVASNSPAARAGLRTNDQVIGLNGDRLYNWAALVQLEDSFSNSPVKPVVFTVRRGTNQFDVTLSAEKPIKPKNSNPSFGILSFLVTSDEVLVYPRPLYQIQESAGQIFATLGTVLSRKSDVGVQQLGGPVMIIRAYRAFLDSENGWRRVLWFSVVLNVNLALLNLLPFPVLDGGHIALALIEGVRRRAVSPKFLNALQTACAMLLIGFMLFIAFFDIGDWIRSGAVRDHDAVKVFAAPKQ